MMECIKMCTIPVLRRASNSRRSPFTAAKCSGLSAPAACSSAYNSNYCASQICKYYVKYMHHQLTIETFDVKLLIVIRKEYTSSYQLNKNIIGDYW